jgi:hypothetical protein
MLIRRLYLELLGLLPGSDEVAQCKPDTGPDAYPTLPERIVSSPEFGKR